MEKVAYLTIDDAPSADFSAKVRFLLERHIPAVFFCQGNLLEQHLEAAIEAVQLGFVLGNHSYSHPSFSSISVAECQEQILRTDALLTMVYERAGVAWRRKYFRFPYGDRGDLKMGHLFEGEAARWKGTGLPGQRRWHWLAERVRRLSPARVQRAKTLGLSRATAIQQFLQEHGYQLPPFPDVSYTYLQTYTSEKDWPWTFDAMEWSLRHQRPLYGLQTQDEVLARLAQDNPPDLRGPVPETAYGLPYLGSAEIILLHDHAETGDAFCAIIEHLRKQGVCFKAPN